MRAGLALSGFAAFVALLGWPCASSADRLVAAPLRMSGPVSPSQRDSFVVSLAGGLAAAGHEVVSADELARVLREQPALASCDTDTCLTRLGALVSARAVLRAAVEALGSSNYHVRLELFEPRLGRVVASLDDSCTVCTAQEAREALSRAAAALARKLPALAERTVAPALVAPPPAPAAARTGSRSTPRSRLFLGLGVSALVLGLGAVSGGAYLLAVDGRSEQSVDPLGRVEITRQETLLPGALVTTAGGLLLVGGGLLLWRSHAARAPSLTR